jgi:ABC-type multidrug transport system permease subunit
MAARAANRAALLATVSIALLAPASAFRFVVDFNTADGKATLAVIFTFSVVCTTIFATCVYYCTKIDDSLIQERMQQVRSARAARGACPALHPRC